MADSTFDHIEAFIASLPGDLPVHDQIAHLARTLKIATWPDARWASRRIREITDYAPWLPSVIAGTTHREAFLAALRLIEGHGAAPIPKSRGRTADLPALATLTRPVAGAPYLEAIRAIYLGGTLAPGLAATPIAATHLEDLGTAIRSIDLRSKVSHPLRDEFGKAFRQASPAQLAKELFADPPSADGSEGSDPRLIDHPVAACWQRVWRPWLLKAEEIANGEQIATIPKDRSPAEPGTETQPTDPSTAKQKKRSGPAESPLRGSQVSRVRLPGINCGFATEPEDESAASIAIVQMPTRTAEQVPAEEKYEIAYAHQQIRHQNTSLLTSHIDVLSLGEWQLVTAKVIAAASVDPHDSFDSCRDATFTRLEGLTSLHPDRLSTLSLSPSPDGLSVDLDQGILLSPVIAPEHVRKIAPQYAHKFEPTSSQFRRALPPDIIRNLRALYSLHPCARIRDWFVNTDSSDAVKAVLEGLDVPTASQCPHRFRRTAAAHFQEIGQDLVHTVISTVDTQQRALTPMHYYSPLEKTLRDLGHQVEKRACPTAASPKSIPRTGSPQRIGAAAVLKAEIAKKGYSEISNTLNSSAGAAEAANPVTARAIHNRLATHLMSRIPGTAAHRPHKAIFRLTRYTFDLLNHYGILDDKRSDPSHCRRIVGTTTAFSELVRHFLIHLLALSQQTWATSSFRLHVQKVVTGQAPLLCFMREDLELRDGRPSDWKASWPAAWEGVPDNWHRPFLSTHLRELGADPACVMMHLGHLEGSGWLLSADSPVSAAAALEQVRPALEKVEKLLGFKTRTGFSALCAHDLPVLQLQDWTSKLAKADRESRALQKMVNGVMRSRLRNYRDLAERWLTADLEALSPELSQIIMASRTRNPRKRAPDHLKDVAIDDAVLVQIIDAIQKTFESDEIARIAVHNRLCTAIRHARSSLGLRCIDIGRFIAGPAADPSPFLLDQAIATEHVTLLREHLAVLGRQTDRLIPTVVRRALALTLFAGMTDAEKICRLVVYPRNQVVPAGVDGGIFLTLEERNRPATIGLNPEAALPFLFKSSTPVPERISVEELSEALAQVLPPALIGERRTLLRRLCSTVRVSNLYERSGLERIVLSDQGPCDAIAAQQNAFFSGQMPPVSSITLVDSPEPVLGLDADDDCREEADFRSSQVRHARRVYTDMLKAITRASIVRPPPDGRPDRGWDRKVNLAQVQDALDAMRPPRGQVLTIDEALIAFVSDLAINGTPEVKEPSIKTLHTYATSIGGDLVEQFGGFDLNALDVLDLYEGYRTIIGTNNKKEPAVAVRAESQCRHFHECLVREYGIEPLPPGLLGDRRTKKIDNRDPQLVSEAEYLAALAWLLKQCAHDGPDDSIRHARWRRGCMQAAVALILLWRSGARIEEIARCRFIDLAMAGTWCVLIIRPSLYLSLKTAAARRLVELSHRLTASERAVIADWIALEKSRIDPKMIERSLLLGRITNPRRASGSGRVRSLIQAAFTHTTRRKVWPHLLRHAWLSRELPSAAIDAAFNKPSDTYRRCRTVCAEVGHVLLQTGIYHYLHDGWRIVRTPPTVVKRHVARWELAFLSGQSVDSVDKWKQVAKQSLKITKDDPGGWTLAAVEAGIRLLKAPATDGTVRSRDADSQAPIAALTPYELAALLTAVDTVDELITLAPCWGLTSVGAERVWRLCAELSSRCHYRLVPLPTRRKNTLRDPVPRQGISREIDSLLVMSNLTTARALTDGFLQCYSPSAARLDCFQGPSTLSLRFASTLRSVGITVETISDNDVVSIALPHDGGLSGFHGLVFALATLWVWLRMQD
jgi:hypothetical protein